MYKNIVYLIMDKGQDINGDSQMTGSNNMRETLEGAREMLFVMEEALTRDIPSFVSEASVKVRIEIGRVLAQLEALEKD